MHPTLFLKSGCDNSLPLARCPVGPTCRRQLLRPRASLFSLYLVGQIRQVLSRCLHTPLLSLCTMDPPCQFLPPRARRGPARAHSHTSPDSRPRRPPTRPAPFLEPRQYPHSLPLPHFASSTLSRTLPTPPDTAGDLCLRSQPSSSLEVTPSLPELRPEVRHLSPCLISLVSLCARPILASPVLGRDGPPCSRGGRPI
jgi:hypothetical protein